MTTVTLPYDVKFDPANPTAIYKDENFDRMYDESLEYCANTCSRCGDNAFKVIYCDTCHPIANYDHTSESGWTTFGTILRGYCDDCYADHGCTPNPKKRRKIEYVDLTLE